jgi:hypothetical protein
MPIQRTGSPAISEEDMELLNNISARDSRPSLSREFVESLGRTLSEQPLPAAPPMTALRRRNVVYDVKEGEEYENEEETRGGGEVGLNVFKGGRNDDATKRRKVVEPEYEMPDESYLVTTHRGPHPRFRLERILSDRSSSFESRATNKRFYSPWLMK